MPIIHFETCDLCAAAIPVCGVPDCHECWTGEHEHPLCACCLGTICSKHQEAVTCPHTPADHEQRVLAGVCE